MRITRSIAAATIAVAITMTMAPRASMAQGSPPDGAAAPAVSEPADSGAVAHPKHHKKKQSFMQKMKGKLTDAINKKTGPKAHSNAKRNGPAKSAGPNPNDVE